MSGPGDETSYEFEAVLWASTSVDSWVFLTVPADVDEDVRLVTGPPQGFGSVRVEVTIGATTWRTSVFPDTGRGYVLPVKKAVRRAESLEVGDSTRLRLVLLRD